MEFDILIIGAGVAGLSAASFLSNRGLHVAIVDKGIPHVLKSGECLMADALPIMKKLGYAYEFLASNHLSLEAYQVKWGNQETYQRHLVSSPTGTGWVVDRKVFDDMLLQKCLEHEVSFFWEQKIDQLSHNGLWEILTSGKETNELKASFVIDASGRARAFTRRIGIKKFHSDKLLATCCHLEGQSDKTDRMASIISDTDGWWYYAQYCRDKGSLAYFTDADLPQHKTINHLQDKAKSNSILKALLLDKHFIPTTFMRNAAYSSAIQNCVGDGWLAMGDAAMSFDPLSSFGMTSAMSSAFYGSQAIMRFFHNQPEYLKTYQQLLQQNYLSYLKKRKIEYAKVSNSESKFWLRRQ
ncbi:NAD(P)/FAD-dependent oxidoreductase [Reichenbachiella versicolor]|uniref:NAD(P)/FAD-dependent oxidoreductase n=1 Tax=Reichenbachiella versicolor TaxID=1821036 RepID=UPI000D6E4F16|nr:NAD(P)/FAD-dependent oxidoreductase [Reichenbachiella versicolor]